MLCVNSMGVFICITTLFKKLLVEQFARGFIFPTHSSCVKELVIDPN